MIIRINGAALNPFGEGGFIDKIADHIIESEVELIVKPISHALGELVKTLYNALAAYSPEIVALGIVLCGFGTMLSALTGGGGKWLGRTFLITWLGIVWRLVT